MTDQHPKAPARLFTSFGTVLYIDGTGELRHGPTDASPANVFLVAELSAHAAPLPPCRLIAMVSGVERPIACEKERCRILGESNAEESGGTRLQLVPLERGLFALKGGGNHVSAIPDGSVRLSAPICSTWECFLASEDWCGEAGPDGRLGVDRRDPSIAALNIKKHIIDPRQRVVAESTSPRRKILIYGYPQWSHGRVYYEICKRLHHHGYLVDILNWQTDHGEYIDKLTSYYDLFMTSPDGVVTLSDAYRVPLEKMIVVSHHEMDIRMLIEQRGVDIFDHFGAYGVVSYQVYSASLVQGVRRSPVLVPLGVDFEEFRTEPCDRLEAVGYASSMSVTTFGVEWKRGYLAEEAARRADLPFRVAGSTAEQTSFHEMPEFYEEIGAALFTSVNESAGLPVMEAAAAGRLVIGTPVGHFPLRAYQGGGIIAPIEPDKFVAFASATLNYYKDRPSEYVDTCAQIQTAARAFDWSLFIGEWTDLVEGALR